MRGTLLKIAAFMSAFVLLASAVVLTNQTLQIVQAASHASPSLGKLVLYSLLALYTTLILAPLVLYLRLPKQLSPPASVESPDFPLFLAALRKRLSRNSLLREHLVSTQQEVEAAIAVLDKEVNTVVRTAASSIFLTTAVCQSGRLDMLVVLSVQTKLIWKIAHVYYQRPSLRDFVSLYANVAATAFIAGDIEDIDLDPVIAAIFGSAAASIPGTRLIADSIVSGAANAFLTLRVGMVAKRYCNCLVRRERRLIKRRATLEAAKMIPVIVKENTTRLMKAAGNRIADKLSWPWSKARSTPASE